MAVWPSPAWGQASGWLFEGSGATQRAIDQGSDRGTPAPVRRPATADPGRVAIGHAKPWQSRLNTSAGRSQLPPDEQPVDPPYGYPRAQDPLFDDGTRLPYARQHLVKQRWNRPSYAAALPQYVKPSYGQEPIRKPAYQMPLAVMPLDNKPRWQKPAYVPPDAVKPSWEFPNYMERPNYVHQPLIKPAENRPAYDRSGIRYDRPEYLPPAYVPQEYKPPRYAPSPYIAPPK